MFRRLFPSGPLPIAVAIMKGAGQAAVPMPCPSEVGSSGAPCNLSEQRRGLKQARTPFGFYLQRNSRKQYPAWRRPFRNGQEVISVSAPHYHFQCVKKTQNAFLPSVNYITGDWTGLFYVSREQIYTLQHATSGAPVRVRRFPTLYDFTNAPSRWLIGRPLKTHARPRVLVFDELMLTKKQRLDYVKAGLLPK